MVILSAVKAYSESTMPEYEYKVTSTTKNNEDISTTKIVRDSYTGDNN